MKITVTKLTHPDMRAVMQPLAQYLVERLPLFFSDLEVIKKRYHEVL